jgi:predicted TIM-barrel fold metal-dependent hydrolase
MRRTLFLTCLLAAGLMRAAAAQEPVPFVDAHVHLNDVAMQLDLMDRHAATQAIVFWGGRSDNTSVADAARLHPQRFIPFASISPERSAYRPLWQRNDTALLAQLAALLATGRYRGIGEISAVHFASAGFGETDFDLAGPMTTGIMELARKHRVPVLLHVEITRLAEMSALLERFADVPVIWAHGGYTPLEIAQRLLARHPNLSYELSARTWASHPRSPEYTLLRDGRAVWPQWLALIEAQPSRFVVGTDASHRSRASEEIKFASVQGFLRQLSPATRERVARENILALVGAPPK